MLHIFIEVKLFKNSHSKNKSCTACVFYSEAKFLRIHTAKINLVLHACFIVKQNYQ